MPQLTPEEQLEVQRVKDTLRNQIQKWKNEGKALEHRIEGLAKILTSDEAIEAMARAFPVLNSAMTKPVDVARPSAGLIADAVQRLLISNRKKRAVIRLGELVEELRTLYGYELTNDEISRALLSRPDLFEDRDRGWWTLCPVPCARELGGVLKEPGGVALHQNSEVSVSE